MRWLPRTAILLLACASALASTTEIAPGSNHCTIARNAHGRIVRSRTELAAFRHMHPCPATQRSSGPCPGYVIDHFRPLCACGKDAPANMQWQTRAESRAKDRKEDALCASLTRKAWVE